MLEFAVPFAAGLLDERRWVVPMALPQFPFLSGDLRSHAVLLSQAKRDCCPYSLEVQLQQLK